MAKDYSVPDIRKLKKVSTLAKMYKDGVSKEYMHKLKKQYDFEMVVIDGVQFVDVTTLPEEVKQHIKKI